MTGRISTFCAVCFLVAVPAYAADWTQWRGPQRTGVSAEKGLADSWPAGGPNLVWQSKELGDGYGTPSIVAGRIYVLGNDGLEDEFVQGRLDAASGQQICGESESAKSAIRSKARITRPLVPRRRSTAIVCLRWVRTATSFVSNWPAAASSGKRISAAISTENRVTGLTPNRRSLMAMLSSARPAVSMRRWSLSTRPTAT